MKELIEEMAQDIYDALPDYEHNARDCRYAAEEMFSKGYRKQSEWISVEDRLPTPFVSVLVYMPDETPHPTVREGFVNKRGKWYAGGFDRSPDEVVAWKAMPEPPKMKGGAE